MYCSILVKASIVCMAMGHPTDECREDALRHLNPYQCKICGKRFGKRFAKTRHERKRNPCVPVEGDRISKPAFWVSLELRRAVSELEKAKGYVNVTAAIHKCKHICGESFLLLLKLALYLDSSTA